MCLTGVYCRTLTAWFTQGFNDEYHCNESSKVLFREPRNIKQKSIFKEQFECPNICLDAKCAYREYTFNTLYAAFLFWLQSPSPPPTHPQLPTFLVSLQTFLLAVYQRTICLYKLTGGWRRWFLSQRRRQRKSVSLFYTQLLIDKNYFENGQ